MSQTIGIPVLIFDDLSGRDESESESVEEDLSAHQTLLPKIARESARRSLNGWSNRIRRAVNREDDKQDPIASPSSDE